MAESVNTSVLLPRASVGLYGRDPQTADSLKALASDWRFARVRLDHHEGDAALAIADLQGGKPAPDLLIIETDTIDDSFTARLETLAAHCPEGTAAIVIGPVNDVNLYRKLITMGISDYLVRPVKSETLAFDIARSLIDRVGASGSRLIALMGAKGGVGTSALAQAMAWGAADILDQKTILLDGAGGWSSLSVGMNFEPATTLAEAARAATAQNEDAFRRMLFHASEKLHVLSSGGDAMLEDTVDAPGFESLLDRVMKTYPVVIADLSHAPATLHRIVAGRAHQIILVTTPLLPALRSARTLLQEMKDFRSDTSAHLDLVVNMAGFSPKHEVGKADLESALDRKPSLNVEFSPALFTAAESEGRKLGATPAGEALVRDLMPLLAKILDGVAADGAASEQHKKNPLSGLFDKLKSKG